MCPALVFTSVCDSNAKREKLENAQRGEKAKVKARTVCKRAAVIGKESVNFSIIDILVMIWKKFALFSCCGADKPACEHRACEGTTKTRKHKGKWEGCMKELL